MGFFSFFIACVVAIGVHIFFSSPIPPPSLSQSVLSNSKLQEAVKLGEGSLMMAEDVVVDKNGFLYTVTRDGWIKRLNSENGTWENWKWFDSEHMYGITPSEAGGIYICDAELGLLKVTEEDGATVLGTLVNGRKPRWANDAVEGSDGKVYFSVLSAKRDLKHWYVDLLEGEGDGQLLKYDPSLNETSILLEGLAFANGVALSAHQDFLIICETAKYRCQKYWLKKEKRGQTEIFIDNLPGGPDNINLAPDGTFWIALVQIIPPGLSYYVYKSRVFKYLLTAFPKLIPYFNVIDQKAMVVNVDTNGNIIKFFDDPTGKILSFVTNVMEFDGHLYLASLTCNCIAKLPLSSAST